MGMNWNLKKMPEAVSSNARQAQQPQPAQGASNSAQPGGNIVTNNLDTVAKVATKAGSFTNGNLSNAVGILGQQAGASNLANGISAASQASGIGAGQLGGVSSTTAMGGSGAVASAIAALPFTAFAGAIASKIINSVVSDKPKIGFSGTQPQYGYNNGKYFGPQQDKKTRASTIKPSSKKYDYVVSVSETGKDGEIEKQLVEAFDQYFDVLSSQGVPVNDLLARNKNFSFGGRLDKGTTPESVLNDFIAHSLPDIEAYQAGVEPPERQIRVEPKGTVNGMAGRTAYDLGIKNPSYSVVVGPDGAQRNKTVRLSINDPRVALINAEKKGLSGRSTEDLRGSLTPGFTYVVDASKLPGRTADEMGLSGGLRYTVPDASGSPKSEPMPFKAEKNTGVVKAPGVLQMNWNQKSKYVFGGPDTKATPSSVSPPQQLNNMQTPTVPQPGSQKAPGLLQMNWNQKRKYV